MPSDCDGDGLTDLAELNGVQSSKSPVRMTEPCESDTDGDGCTDAQEVSDTQGQGGRRDPMFEWDYFNPSHDKQNRVDDILLVVSQYFKDVGNPAYNPDMDRTYVGPNAWNLGPPNGMQRVDDILNEVQQYFHDCS